MPVSWTNTRSFYLILLILIVLLSLVISFWSYIPPLNPLFSINTWIWVPAFSLLILVYHLDYFLPIDHLSLLPLVFLSCSSFYIFLCWSFRPQKDEETVSGEKEMSKRKKKISIKWEKKRIKRIWSWSRGKRELWKHIKEKKKQGKKEDQEIKRTKWETEKKGRTKLKEKKKERRGKKEN